MMRPFHVEWAADAVERVLDQVKAYRFPRVPSDDGWKYGCDRAFLQELCAYWVDGFDVAAAARNLNRFPQVVHRVDDVDVHVVHLVGEAQGKRPLLVTHGWPGSFFEFWKVAEPLAFPSRFGGRAEDAFDLVVPSLPGYGFSSQPSPSLGSRSAARLFDRLMREGFGYARYFAQGGDVGSSVTTWLALEHASSVRAIHLNFASVQPDATAETAEEKAWQADVQMVQQKLGAYMFLQVTKPQSLAYAMADNPVAQAAWLVERFHDWADLRERSFAETFSKDELLTEVMIYVMNDAFTSSTWSYAASGAEGSRKMPAGKRVEVPTAFAAFHDPRVPNPPRCWMERGYAIERWTEMPRGGHFAAMEAPDLFVDDVRAWFRDAETKGA